MRNLIFLAFVAGAVCTSSAQYCTNVGPSSLADSNIESVTIVGDLGTLLYTGCPPIIGLEDQTIQEVYLTPGGVYTLDVQFGTCGGNYAGAGEAWIDFNQDLQFDASESIGSWSGGIPTPLSQFNFTVPNLLPQGTARMRVMHREGGSLPLDPCATYTWGSVVDFTVKIQPGGGCDQYLGNLPTDPIQVDALPYIDTNSNVVCYGNQSSVYISPDVFYRVAVDQLGVEQLNIDLCNSNFDTHLTVFDTQMNPILNNDDGANCGANAQIYLPTAGLDTILIAVEGWNTETGEYILTIEGSTLSLSNQEDKQWVVFPNPTNNFITIQSNEFDKAIVFDLNGKKIVQTTKNVIDFSAFNAGVYLLEIQTDKQVWKSKIIKQ